MANRWGSSGNSDRFLFSWAQKWLKMVTAAMKLKDTCCLEEKLWPTQTIWGEVIPGRIDREVTKSERKRILDWARNIGPRSFCPSVDWSLQPWMFRAMCRSIRISQLKCSCLTFGRSGFRDLLYVQRNWQCYGKNGSRKSDKVSWYSQSISRPGTFWTQTTPQRVVTLKM